MRVLFIGSKRMGLKALRRMYEISPNELIGAITIEDGRDTRSVFGDFFRYCDNINLPLHTVANKAEFNEIVMELKPDICFVVGWYWIIDKRILDSVPRGFIGVHNSLLPKYRGCAPLVWAIINDENEVGFSLFSFTEDMDAGDIWSTGAIPVHEDDYIDDILYKLEDKLLSVLDEKYLSILRGEIEPYPQKHEDATFCAPRIPADGEIDWSRPARYIYKFIRAQSKPYPGAYTIYKGRMLKIWRAKPYDAQYFGTPGQVAWKSKEGVYVVCGDNRVIILENVEFDDIAENANKFIKSLKTRFGSKNIRNSKDRSASKEDSSEPGRITKALA
ncbi:MAG: hypothetical protein GF315_08950 [candidate division Zixibacteria bacterium]|nr:hypothetical protein [candidate division Zixibacteria bacterium]